MARPSWAVERFDGNPVLEPEPRHRWESKAVFNPGALYEAGYCLASRKPLSVVSAVV